MNDKPLIRHCKNCEYSTFGNELSTNVVYCKVKYILKFSYEQRVSALLCRYYKRKDDEK
jgi:acetyl-CoA carboxylase beta subunit